jgi:hypothetical protein
MRNLAAASVLILGALGFSGEAYAKGTLGIGLVGEDPSGLTVKYKMSEKQALDFRLGIGFRFDNAFLGQVNYLISPFELANTGDFSLPFYVGLGGTLFVFNNGNNDGIAINARVPIGVALELNAVPLDIFLEVAPQLGLIPDVDVFIDGAVGVRFWF